MQKQCSESISAMLQSKIKQLIFSSDVKQQQSVIFMISVLCKLFKAYTH